MTIVMAAGVREALQLIEVSQTLSKMCLINMKDGVHC